MRCRQKLYDALSVRTIACYQKAIELEPKHAMAHNNLGHSLHAKGQVDEAVASYRKAVALDPTLANAHYSLGRAAYDKGQLNQAITCFNKAIALNPKYADAHTNLGTALTDKGRWDEAIACFERALTFNPRLGMAYYMLGIALGETGQWDAAIACFRKATELDPMHAEAHCNLGDALARRGRFAESLAAKKRGHELGSKRRDWRYPSAEWVRHAEANVALEAKLPAFLNGEFRPGDSEERLVLARVCWAKKLYRHAIDLYAAAFAADPKLADDLSALHRHAAARYAALAAAVEGEDAAKFDDKERTRFRKQALEWLRADLALHGRQLETGNPADRAAVRRQMLQWQQDNDLAGLRDAAALARMPAEEQKAFIQLWADVAALLKKTAK
jgi:tetratricopeptide (TPR) repeat protein